MSARRKHSPQTAARATVDAPRTAGQRAGVTREAVRAAAHGIVERDGVEHLTMRRLAVDLGVTPNALYTYFPNKTAIIDALLDAVLADVEPHHADGDTWQESLAALMRASRRALLAHPRLVPFFVARPGGPNAFRLGEAALQILGRGGVYDRTAVEALRALLVYTLGFAAIEVPRMTDPESAERLMRVTASIGGLSASEFPATLAAQNYLAMHPSDRDFETGLAWLLTGIAREGRHSSAPVSWRTDQVGR